MDDGEREEKDRGKERRKIGGRRRREREEATARFAIYDLVVLGVILGVTAMGRDRDSMAAMGCRVLCHHVEFRVRTPPNFTRKGH